MIESHFRVGLQNCKHVFILFAVAAAVNCFGSGFEIAGHFNNTMRQTNGQTVVVNGSFSATVSGCKWRIRTRRADEKVDYFEAGSEGAGEIFLIRSNTNLPQKVPIAPTIPLQTYLGFSQIIKGVVPHFSDAEQLCIIWLAYGSECYFASRTNNQIEPVFWQGGRSLFNRDFMLPATWELSPDAPRLPNRVVYFNDGFIRGTDHAGRPKVIPNPPLYAKGYTNAVFEVTGYLNCEDIRLPGSFRLTTFRMNPDGESAADLLTNRVFAFTATNATRLIEEREYIPSIPGRTLVRDFRQKDGDAFHSYEVTNVFPTTREVLQQPGLVSDTLARQLPTSNTKILIRVILLIFVFGGPIAVLKVSRSKKNKPENKTLQR